MTPEINCAHVVLEPVRGQGLVCVSCGVNVFRAPDEQHIALRRAYHNALSAYYASQTIRKGPSRTATANLAKARAAYTEDCKRFA